METHRALGPGLDEIIYHRLLSFKLTEAGIAHEFKPRGQLIHREFVADEFECDLLVEGRLIPELKALDVAFAPDHFTQTICYMKFWRVETSLLFDFGKESLVFKRIRYEPATPRPVDCRDVLGRLPAEENRSVVQSVCDRLGRIYSAYGLGYRGTTYRGLFIADLKADGIPHVAQPIVSITHANTDLGRAQLGCLVVDECCALTISALKAGITAADQAVLKSYLRHLDLPWGLAANFGKKKLDVNLVLSP
jgi:GxxExxY protein